MNLRNYSFKFIQGDRRKFKLSEKVDLVAIFMDSTSYLLTNDDGIGSLKPRVKFSNETSSWRMIPVLRKK